MLEKRKICVLTGTRAEFGLLYWLIDEIFTSSEVDLQLVVTGMHLSPEFGFTVSAIEESKFPIKKRVEMLLSSDTAIGISKSIGLGIISFCEVFDELKPDVIVILGDRFEMFSAASAAMIGKYAIAHIHGGEATEGLIDEPIRHSITKMAHLHFTAADEYRKRVIQLGEQPERVFNTGTPGLDNISKLELLNREDFEKSINFELGEVSALVTFHPVTLENSTAEYQFKELLNALNSSEGLKIIFTKPNADTDGRVIIDLIDEFVASNPQKSCSFVSLGQLRYLSALRHVSLVIGNSSSGLTEAPSFNVPTINIGDRQRGRLKAESVIDCLPKKQELLLAFDKALSPDFLEIVKRVKNPYGSGGASERIFNILKTFPLNGIIKKEFYDL
ncbi:MAG: GDP/UDP-N,N'-diacetylbacillosamine 2-epimerase (hydrolyzing) [Bacteroidia bacterium]|jgi:GDP/UDP-N,N'-diacetylbacillosamine 2-epimerase (hydrolysing)